MRHNNVALLFLKKSLDLTHHINLICLPPPNRNFIYNRCIVSGWGKKNFENINVQKKMCPWWTDLGARATSSRNLWQKLLSRPQSDVRRRWDWQGCVQRRMACPLQRDPNRYEQVGIVNYGLVCGTDIPAVYTDVSKMRPCTDYQIKCLPTTKSKYLFPTRIVILLKRNINLPNLKIRIFLKRL